MAIISDTRNYLFIQAPDTGCTAIADKVLIPHLDGRLLPTPYLYDADGNTLVGKHGTVGELIEHGLLPADAAARLFKFSAVRNPFDTMVSQYFRHRVKYRPLLDVPNSWVNRSPTTLRSMRIAMSHDFPEWIEVTQRLGWRRVLRERHLYERSDGWFKWTVGVDYVMRYERLQSDFDTALRRIGVDAIEIPRHNVTGGRDPDYRGYYTPRARRIIERSFAPYLRQFEYSF